VEDQIRQLCDEYLEYEEHPDFLNELKRLVAQGDDASLRDRFYTQLAFGTGGLRGRIGAGYNRMNPYVVSRATQGLAAYIQKQHVADPSVVLAYDSRDYSKEFAQSAALVLCQNGIKAYVFSSLRPTPELSFAVRELNAVAGIVITASHNPKEYNGYKVYWSDGGQIVPPHDRGILKEAAIVTGRVASMHLDVALERNLLEYIDRRIDDAYLSMIGTYLLRKDALTPYAKGLKVVYTALHGTGAMLVEKLLGSMGVSCISVPEQREPDGAFPTVESPNPEEATALAMAIRLAREENAILVLGTDPDSDRLGVAIRDGDEYVLITGNQLGSLLCDYVFSTRKELGTLPRVPVLVKTIVTTELQRRIAQGYGARVYDVLTGFKYIGEKIREFEGTDEEYVFGGEESFGYLVETEVRDKDALSSAALTVEMATFLQSKGSSLVEYLDQLYAKHGYFQESLISRSFEGEAGKKRISELMTALRSEPPASIGGQSVREVRDYLDGIDLPRSDVLQFVLENGVLSVRPSGTEPKVKFYVSCFCEPGEVTPKAKVSTMLAGIEREVLRIVGE
jgi:phosphoglucomutase